MGDKTNAPGISYEESVFKRKIWQVTWVTLVLPPLTGIFMLSFVGVFPFPEVFYPFTNYAAIVVSVAALLGIWGTRIFIRDAIQIAQLASIPTRTQRRLRALPFYYFGILFLYFGVGLVSTLYSLSTLYGYNYPLEKYYYSFLGVIPGGLITALPIFFYLTDSLGQFLAPHGIKISVAPIKLKITVLGLFIPVLIDTLLLMYFKDRTGYFSLETVGIWFFLIVIAAVGTRMAWTSFRQSLSPFVNALAMEDGEYKNISIVPQSLDELGLLSHQWRVLWLRVLDYETKISASNLSLQDEVEKRTQELEAERTFINTVLEKAGALIVVLDKCGCIIRFNSACERLTCFSFGELRNQPIWEWLIPPEQLEAVKHVFSNLATEGFDSQYENDLMTSDGGRIPIAWNNSTIHDDNGDVQYIVSVGLDISERRTTQAAVEKARQEAEKASRAKSDFLSRMSHELRTPMNAILGFGQLLEADNANLTGEQRQFVSEILQGGNHLLSLINEVLDLAKIEEGKMHVEIQDVNLNKVIATTLRLLKQQALARDIHLSFDVPSDVDYLVKADALRLKQVLINIISNAIKYNREHGEVKISATRQDSGRLRLSVRDTGPGIPPTMQDRLFKPFERLENANLTVVEGTGIGLALSKRLMGLMQGDIGVVNGAAEGCTFFIELPYAGQVQHAMTLASTISQPVQAPHEKMYRYTVLYVEDNSANLRLVETVLRSRGDIHLLTAHTGNLGLDLAFSYLPDLILLDINLPGMNGLEILGKLKKADATREIPVIAVTANAMTRDVEAGLAAGFVEYLVKPLDIKRFHAVTEPFLPITVKGG